MYCCGRKALLKQSRGSADRLQMTGRAMVDEIENEEPEEDEGEEGETSESPRPAFRAPWMIPDSLYQSVERITAIGRDIANKVDFVHLDRVQRTISSLLPDVARNVAAMQLDAEQLFARFARQINLPDFGQWAELARQSLARALPSNWATIDDWLGIVDLMEETKWSLVWVPGPDVLTRMLEADGADAAGLVLVEHRAAVIADVREALEEVTDPSLATYREGLESALPVAELGHYAAAQSLSATVFKGMIETALDGTLHKASGKWRALRLMEHSVRDMRRVGVLVAAGAALDRYYPLKGDPVPTSFNRHAVAHGYTSEQFTPVNAMTGLLLAASLLRELQEWVDDVAEEAV